MSDASVFILLGATGDLARRKVIPALYQLIKRKEIEPFCLVGVALEESNPSLILNSAKPFITDMNESVFLELEKRFTYCQLDFTRQEDFKRLAQHLAKIASAEANRIVYCAIPAFLFCSTTQKLAQEHIIWRDYARGVPWCRVVYEKPFGQNLDSAHEINTCIAKYLNERQIYRVDHYLGKDVIGSIALLRFSNIIFEPLWNKEHVEWMEITLSESIGIDHRGAYYDEYGALKDVVQNHMLQMLSLLTMESPAVLEGNYIRDQKSKILRQVKCVDGILGQYKDYRKEAKVNPQSNTETFAALKLIIENERWKGVPFYLKTGKYLTTRETKIIVQFKRVECLLSHHCPSAPNYLEITINPEANFKLAVNVKKPGLALEVEQVFMNFHYEHHFSPGAVSGYEAVLEEIVRGEQSISVRFDEIEYAWSIIDSIKKSNFPLYEYERGSHGPVQALAAFAQRNFMRWQ